MGLQLGHFIHIDKFYFIDKMLDKLKITDNIPRK